MIGFLYINKKITLLLLMCLLSPLLYSQTDKEISDLYNSTTVRAEIQELYDQTTLFAYSSYNKSLGIPGLCSLYGWSKVFGAKEVIESATNGTLLVHSKDIGNASLNPYYYENIFITGGDFSNIHPFRGNVSYQPQWPYYQMFLIYKIELLKKTHLNI